MKIDTKGEEQHQSSRDGMGTKCVANNWKQDAVSANVEIKEKRGGRKNREERTERRERKGRDEWEGGEKKHKRTTDKAAISTIDEKMNSIVDAIINSCMLLKTNQTDKIHQNETTCREFSKRTFLVRTAFGVFLRWIAVTDFASFRSISSA